jgi:hypothetical protein
VIRHLVLSRQASTAKFSVNVAGFAEARPDVNRRFGWGLPKGPAVARPPPIFVSRHQASAAPRDQPRAHTSLQSEAEAAWYDRLSPDLLWRGLSKLTHENIANPKQAGRACYSAQTLLFDEGKARKPASYVQLTTRVLLFCAKALSPRAKFTPQYADEAMGGARDSTDKKQRAILINLARAWARAAASQERPPARHDQAA